jgi:hypothetical protein
MCFPLISVQSRAIAQVVSRRLPTAAARVQTRVWSCVGFCDGQKWRWGRFSPRTSVSPANPHSICFSTMIFTVTRGWHNRPGVAAVPIASQTELKKKIYRYSIVGIATSYGMDDPGVGVRVPVGARIFPSPRRPHRLCGPPNLVSNGYRGALSLAVKRLRCEADPSPPTSAEVKKMWIYTSTPPYAFMA